MRAKNIFQVSVRFRILSIGIVATLGFISYLAFNFFVNQANIEDMASIKEKDYPIIERADHIITKLDSVQSHFLSALMEADEDEAETANMLVIKIKKDFKDITGFDGSRQSLESLSKINKLLSSYDGLSTTLIKRVIEDDISMQESSMKSQQINIIYEQLKKSIKDFRNSYYIEANKTIDAVNERASNALVLGIIIGVMMILMVTWIAEYNARLITRNINNVTKFLDKMSNGDGDLTVRITEKGNDELQKLAHAFNRFVDKLQAIITEIGGNSDVLSQASGKCQNYMSHASEEIQTQQLQTDQIATAINQMSASIQEVAQNALLAAEKTEEGHQQTAVGQSEVKGTMEAIDHLAMDLKQAADVITMLGEESDKINSVVTTIRGIAEQTNLLALNAAIEAARAGEQGRGFAVVADEVRALANRTETATQEIHDMVVVLQERANEAIKVMRESQGLAQNSVEQSLRAGSALEEVVVTMNVVRDMITQIASASEQQSSVANEVNKSILDINNVAIRTAQATQDTAEQVGYVTDQASNLHKLVGQFKV